MADILDFCTQKGLESEKVTVSGSHITWFRPETDEEQDRRLEAWKRSDERTEAWERESYARLKAKYGEMESMKPPDESKEDW